ncbi:hypothetical protein V6C27_13810 [Peptococcaceae bacterium 1198_IL3148]
MFYYNKLLTPIRYLITLYWLFLAPAAMAVERFGKYAVIVLLTILIVLSTLISSLPFTITFWESLLILMPLIAILLLDYIFITKKYGKVLIIPSNKLILMLVSKMGGVADFKKIQEIDSKSKFMEIHLLKRAEVNNRHDLVNIVNKMQSDFKGVVFYTYTPIKLDVLFERYKIKYEFMHKLDTKIPLERAMKYQGKKKAINCYIFKV